MSSAPSEDGAAPAFWRDAQLPFIEARSIRNGSDVCYARHAHETFSIGAVNRGTSTYSNGKAKATIGAGSVVVINPADVHACNPIAGSPWSYCMLYVDTSWLGALQHELGLSRNADFRPFSTTATSAPFQALNELHALLTDRHASQLERQGALIGFFSDLQQQLDPAPGLPARASARLLRAAEFISDNFTLPLNLEQICAAAGLSQAHLIRAFKNQFGMTPHAYLVNRRIEHGRIKLLRGRPIAEVAVDVGFADQAHFQRAFKRHLAATPGQYRGRAAPQVR